MATKNKPAKHISSSEAVKKKSGKTVRGESLKKKDSNIPGWMIPVLLLITFAAFFPSLKAGFVNLDDNEYVVNNPLIKNAGNLKQLLITPVQGNYHPVTMFSLFINYIISGGNAWSYHLFNLLVHLVNC